MADVNKQIADLMNQLGSMSYTPPSSYKGYQSTPWSVDRSAHYADNMKQYTPNDFGSLKKSSPSSGGSGINLWDVLSGTIGQPVGYITTMLDNAVKTGKKDFNGSKPWYKELGNFIDDANPAKIIGGTLQDGLVAGAKEQWKDWTDGHLSWGDIPLVGALHGMDKSWKHGSDVAKEFGAHGLGATGIGLGLDIALDPLTYLTGGLSAASKMKSAAEVAKMTELGKSIGLTGKFKNTNDFVNAATDMFKSDLVRRMPNVSESVIDKTVAKKVGDIAEQLKTAGNTAYNSHINSVGMSLPFTNKFVKTGERTETMLGGMVKNPLYRSEALAPQHMVDGLMHEASMGNDQIKTLMDEAVKARYGVDGTHQLTKTMYDDLHKNLSPIIDQLKNGKSLPEVTTTTKSVIKPMDSESFHRIMTDLNNEAIPWKQAQKQFQDIIDQTKDLDPVHRKYYATMLAQTVKNSWTKATKSKAKAMQWFTDKIQELSHSYEHVETKTKDIFPHGTPEANAAKDTRVFDKHFSGLVDKPYNEMSNAKTAMEHFMDTKNIFNPRTLTSKDRFVNSMGEHIADANSQRVGEVARYSRQMDKIVGFLDKQKLDPVGKKNLMEQAIYVLENHAPDSLGKDWLKNPPQAAKDLADHIRPVIDRMGSEEHKAGILDQLRANYFPHVVNKDPETMKAMEEFNKRHPELNGQKATSSFNKERKSFQTLAQRDNYIAKLENAIQKSSDPAEKESLLAQQERVAKMFDTDVVSALQRRIKEGVRAKAMKEMQTKLSKYGMMKSYPKGAEKDVSGLTKLEPDEARKLGLDKSQTHYVHPEVLNGMKRVDEIFTSQGMEKWKRHMVAFADAWRPLVTYYKPSHYINNFIGNVINNMAAGVKASDYKVASKLLKGYRDGTLTDAQMKIIEAAYKHNVISGGFLYDAQHTFSHEIPTKLEKFAEKLANNKAIKNVRHTVGEKVDDVSRLANFVGGMNKYGNTEKAAQQVRTYLFNYNELTNADRTMRTVVPFWNWTKRNVPLQMKTLIENPKFAANNARFMQLFNENQNGADWQKETGIHIPKPITDALGSKNEYYTSFPTPVSDLGQIVNPAQTLGSMSPIPKMVLEMAMNKKFYTGKPISYGSSSTKPEDVPSYLASNMGILGNLYDLISGKKGGGESLANFLHSVNKVNSKNPNGG